MRFGLGVVIAGGLVFAACSSGGDSEPDESRPPPTVATAASTTDAPQPTDPATTVAASTTDPAPPTTEQSIDDLIAEIEADLNEGEQALLTATADPGNEKSAALISRYFIDEARATVLNALDALAADGLVGRPNPDVASVVRLRGLVGQPIQDRARVEFCRIDAGMVVDPQPDGSEAVVNDEVVRYELIVDVHLVDGVWVSAGGGETLSRQPGVAECDD